MHLLGFLLLAYVAGSVNFAIVVLACLGKGDPRTAFSGNAGTTNVYRLAGRGWAGLVLLLDVGRAVALAFLTLALFPFWIFPWVGFALVVGNRFPLFHGFRGGKGVAGFLGFVLPIAPLGALLACLVWVAVHRMVRLPFIASFFMIVILGAGAALAAGLQLSAVAGFGATVLLILRNHRENLLALAEARRKRRGGENSGESITASPQGGG